jgi:hypothetical protein
VFPKKIKVLWETLADNIPTLEDDPAMTGLNGEIAKRQIDREYPHQVAMRVQLGGLGLRLLQLNDFCREHAMPFRTHTDRRDGEDFIRYCFGDPAHADTFASTFSGERSTVLLHDQS